jgi:serine/threonine protein kinase
MLGDNVTAPLPSKESERVGQIAAKKWHIDRLLDIGGMAAVYAATHRNGNRVALKVLHSVYAAQQEATQRFLEEGYVANKVGHPGAVNVLDDDVFEDGTPFLVMELLEGESLEGRLRKRTVLAPNATIFIAEHVLDVLARAHDAGIVHRDIKPGNIFLTRDGGVKVLDFGLARVRERAFKGSLTRTGMVVGTASYMPPEQARGKRDLIDPRTDIWAVGATMFKTMTGRYVHEGDSVNERLIAAMSQKARSIGVLMPGLALPIVDAVDRALAFQKSDRYRDAAAMQSALRKAYEITASKPFPVATRTPLSLLPAAEVGADGAPSPSTRDLAVSVVFEPASTHDSMLVHVEDPSGRTERYEIRNQGADPAIEELPEITVVEVPNR